MIYITRKDIKDIVVNAFLRGISSLESPEWQGRGPQRGVSLERRKAWTR